MKLINKLARRASCLVAVCLVTSTVAFCQSTDSVSHRVYYEHSHIRDREKPEDIYKEDMVLLVGNSSAMFVSYSKVEKRVSYRKEVLAELSSSTGDIPPTIKGVAGRLVTPQEYIKKAGLQTVTVKDYLGRDFVYELNVAPIEWSITEDKRTVMDLECVRATASFKGRDWEVWFAPEVPISFGPWLLDGLPGLVVLAEDSLGEVSYRLKAVENADPEDPIYKEEPDYMRVAITNEKMTDVIKRADFLKLQQQAFKNPREFHIAQIHAMHGRGELIDFGLTNSKSWTVTIPNPIDLKEEKSN